MNTSSTSSANRKYVVFFTCVIAIVAAHLAYFINGQMSLIQIGDNLDAALPGLVSLVRSKSFFSFSNTAFLEGYNSQIHRIVLLCPWDITVVIFKLIPNVWLAYLINVITINTISFAGLFLLNRLLFKKLPWYINLFISFSFMLLPKYYLFGGAVYSSLPFLLFLWLKAVDEPKLKNYVLLFLAPCLSGFAIGGFAVWLFVLSLGVLLFIYKSDRKKPIIISTGILLIGLIISDLNLVLLLFSHIKFHRELRIFSNGYNLSFIKIWQSFLNENYNEQTSSHLAILMSSLCVLAYFIYNRVAKKSESNKGQKKQLTSIVFINVVAWIVLVPIIYTVYINTPLIQTILPITKQFDIGRVSSLNPSLYFILLGFVCNYLYETNNSFITKLAVYVILLCNFVHIVRGNDNLKENIKVAIKKNYNSYYYTSLVPFNVFYDRALFSELKKKHFPTNNELSHIKVMSYGIHPGVLSMHGFNTIDFYCNAYPLEYNYRFQEYLNIKDSTKGLWPYAVSAKEWGNRLYFVDAALDKNWQYKDKIFDTKNSYVANPNFNWGMLASDSVKYVISVLPIQENEHLKISDTIHGNRAYKELFIYMLK